MEFQLPDEVSQNIKAYFPRDKDKSSPTSPIMKSFIETVNDLARFEASFSRKAFDVLNILDEYGIHNDLSNLCGDLQPSHEDLVYYSWSSSDSESDE